MLGAVWTVYRKELTDTLRDRKTLIFMFLLPTIIAPGLILLISHIAVAIVKKQTVETVTIAASAESQQHYLEINHQYFLRSDVGRALRITQSPIVELLVGRGVSRGFMDSIPPAIFTDANAYREWCVTMTDQMRAMMDKDFMPDPGGMKESDSDDALPSADAQPGRLQKGVWEFYTVAIRGLALVHFVDPSTVTMQGEPAPIGELPKTLRSHPRAQEIYSSIRAHQIDAWLEIPDEVAGLSAKPAASAQITLFYDSTVSLSNEAQHRVETAVRAANERIVQARVREAGLGGKFLTPLVQRENTNLASGSRIALAALGGMIPYLIVTFAFLGGMYPAIDLGAGEKERNTLEALLLSPVSRTQIALGKFFLILTTSLMAALLGVTSMMASFYYLTPSIIVDQLDIHIDVYTMLVIAALALPPAAASSGLFLAVSIYARSFKEAQNYLSPLPLLMIVPASAGLIPGIELNAKLAMIPLVNVSLIARDFLKGDVNWLYYGLTFASCLAMAAICLAFCVWMFRREEVLFRS